MKKKKKGKKKNRTIKFTVTNYLLFDVRMHHFSKTKTMKCFNATKNIATKNRFDSYMLQEKKKITSSLV